MFFVILGILGIIGFIVAILAIYMVHKTSCTSRDGLILLWVIIGTIFFFVGCLGTTKVISDVYDIHDTERTINAYIDSEYDAGLYCCICYLNKKKAWADTPFSIWTNEEIDKGLKKASQAYRGK